MKEPLYITICNDIRSKIQNGTLPYGKKLPSERVLSEQYNIDRKTLRKAVSLLIDEGLLVRMQGKGTYITQHHISYKVETLDSLTNTMANSGVTPSTRILFKEKRKAGPKYSRLLNVSADTDILRLVRLRCGDGEPFAIQDTYVLLDLIPGLDQVDFEMYSLYSLMQKQGLRVNRIDETFSFVKLTNPEAGILHLESGSIAFVTEDITYVADNRIVEYTKSIINNNKLAVSMQTPLKE